MPLLAAGSNSHGQLGDGTLEDQHAWKPVLLRRQVTKVAAGGNHTILLCADNTDSETELYGVGDSSRGQLGPFSLSIPTLWDLPDAFRNAVILDIAAAWQTSFVLLRSASADEQTVLASGANDFGLLGCGSNLAERPDWAAVTLTAPQSFKMKRLAASPRHVLVLLDFGASNLKAVYGWGSGRRGELGARNMTACNSPVCVCEGDIIDIAAGMHFSAMLTQSSTSVQLLIFARTSRTIVLANSIRRPMLCASWRHVYLGADSTIARYDTQGNVQEFAVGPGDFTVTAGSEHLLIVKANKVLGVGWNEHGNLGTGHTDNAEQPTQVFAAIAGQLEAWAGCGTSWIQISLQS